MGKRGGDESEGQGWEGMKGRRLRRGVGGDAGMLFLGACHVGAWGWGGPTEALAIDVFTTALLPTALPSLRPSVHLSPHTPTHPHSHRY